MNRSIWSNFDPPLFLLTLLLASLGVIMIYSVGSNVAEQQIIFVIVGFVVFFLFSLFDYRLLFRLAPLLYVIVFILLLGVFIWGLESHGSVRWINIFGFSFQPSEFAKPVLILFFAYFFTTRNMQKLTNVALSFFLVLIPAFFIFRQPDLGNAIVIILIWTGMLIGSGVKWKVLGLTAILAIFPLPLLWRFLHEYQRLRITTFINPYSDPRGAGYNAIQAIIAVGSGQLFGRGLGRGTQSHLQFLPEHYTDFIFASLAEELGLVGATLLLILFILLVWRILKIASSCNSCFGTLIALGILMIFLSQIFINVGMNVGLVPITGITLPLISYGGSSLISTMICLGLVQSVRKFSQERDVDISL